MEDSQFRSYMMALLAGRPHKPDQRFLLLDHLLEVLLTEPDGIKQQQAIEQLMACHAMRVGVDHAETILRGMLKHALQMAGLLGPQKGKS